MTSRSDIVLFLTDQQRFDQVGYAGGGHFHTPNLDRIARSGVIFENAYSASTVCVPARVAHITGIEPSRVPTRRTSGRSARASGRSPRRRGPGRA
jgi:arylsulfatase A-like enzyme